MVFYGLFYVDLKPKKRDLIYFNNFVSVFLKVVFFTLIWYYHCLNIGK
jgi:hypothetical protein